MNSIIKIELSEDLRAEILQIVKINLHSRSCMQHNLITT